MNLSFSCVAGHVRGWSLGAVRAGAWAVTVVVLAGLAGALRGRRATRDVFAHYALGVAAGFLISSVTWPTHLSLAAVPASWLLLAGWSGANRRQPVLLLIAALACAVLFVPLGAFTSASGESADTPAKAGACILLFACVWSLARERAAEGADAGGRTEREKFA